MPYTVPSVADFKARFDRDFSYAVDQTDRKKVRDADVTRGINSASSNCNVGLFSDQATYSEAYLLLTAHYLVKNIQASTQGFGGQGEQSTTSKGIGPLSQSYGIPDRVLRSPQLAQFATTTYGCLFLSIVYPLLVGNIAVVCGGTPPT